MGSLVTGGTGNWGGLVVPRLRDAGGDIRVLSRHRPEATEGIEYVTGDLATGEEIDAAVAERRSSSTRNGPWTTERGKTSSLSESLRCAVRGLIGAGQSCSEESGDDQGRGCWAATNEIRRRGRNREWRRSLDMNSPGTLVWKCSS